MSTVLELKKECVLKGVGTPEFCPGGDVLEMVKFWHKAGIYCAVGAETHTKNVVNKLVKMIKRDFIRCNLPVDSQCHAVLDTAPLLDKIQGSLFTGLVGSANWLATLGRFDVRCTTDTLSRCSMAPKKCCLRAMIRVFRCFKKHPRRKIMIDPSHPDHSNCPEVMQNWKEFCPNGKEDMPCDALERCGNCWGKVTCIACNVDADHAHDQSIHRLATAVLMLINDMPTKWISCHQKTVETSTCGGELTAARIAVEAIMELQHKSRMLSIPMNEPALLPGDDTSVVLNATDPSSPLEKTSMQLSLSTRSCHC